MKTTKQMWDEIEPAWKKNINDGIVTLNLSEMFSFMFNDVLKTINRVAGETGATVTVDGQIITINTTGTRFMSEIVAPGNLREWQWYAWLNIHPGA